MDASNLVELTDNPAIEDFLAGDTVRVSAKVVEGERERTQESPRFSGECQYRQERQSGNDQ